MIDPVRSNIQDLPVRWTATSFLFMIMPSVTCDNSMHLAAAFTEIVCSHSILGTPSEDNWPGVKQLPDYKSTFPKFSGSDLGRCVPELDDDGIELLKATLTYDTAKRISGMSRYYLTRCSR